MLRFFLCLSLAFTLSLLPAQSLKVLVYNEVGSQGYSHPSRSDGVDMITDLGAIYGWTTEVDGDGSRFNSLAGLQEYAVVIFCNTSGNGLLNASQQNNFEQYIQAGGGFVGIHAATDTYRDGSWPWYNDLVGGIVQTGPNHTAANHQNTMDVLENGHPATSHLGATWQKVEEYYYWEQNGGYLADDNQALLRVQQTSRNGQSSSYDDPRPIAWYKLYRGGRSFYTALGHNPSDYQSDSTFIYHVAGGIRWAAGQVTGVAETQLPAWQVIFDSQQSMLRLEGLPAETVQQLVLYDLGGRELQRAPAGQPRLTLPDLPKGIYLLRVQTPQGWVSRKLRWE